MFPPPLESARGSRGHHHHPARRGAVEEANRRRAGARGPGGRAATARRAARGASMGGGGALSGCWRRRVLREGGLLLLTRRGHGFVIWHCIIFSKKNLHDNNPFFGSSFPKSQRCFVGKPGRQADIFDPTTGTRSDAYDGAPCYKLTERWACLDLGIVSGSLLVSSK